MPDRHEPLTFEVLNGRLHEIAAQYQPEYGQVPRIGIHDIAFPATENEYRALNHHAIVLITLVTQSADELPIKRAYLHNAKHDEDMRILASYFSMVSDKAVRDTLGPFREDFFCLVPVAAILASQSELQVDFNAHRKGFVLATFPNDAPSPFYEKSREQLPLQGSSVSESAATELLRREFPDFTGGHFPTQPVTRGLRGSIPEPQKRLPAHGLSDKQTAISN